MNNLQIFNRDIIPVYTTDEGKKVVIGRELHEKLKIGKDYSTWFKDMCEYGFFEGTDFSPVSGKTSEQGGRPRIEHILTLDMAKHIAMIQRTPEGKAIRDKLIELDTNIENLSPELRLLIKLEVGQKQQQKALQETNERLNHIGDVIALDTRSWREDARKLIIKTAQKMGGNEYIRDVQSEIFKLVDSRGGVKLETRLTNKRQRMADEGVCKSKRDRLNKVDVIADDKKLIEIYIAIVKEMAIKYGADQKTA
ncbi:antA/AntB antirepressor family protein [Caproiciproducens galactitolivorans]|uniref:AntA/AntB antirepressor family protein n=1 Tax=Caproiciproducens galactitolivorans TaxID=642589 RepID=A0ABT4BZF7_9FIRM|nr:antA/AntB antirepressor family protein [Caproiciproducens galactitolivorans]MCY1715316.1 antA/AntB antirepressor family protein [Caproiciproducens galactitolivorans]